MKLWNGTHKKHISFKRVESKIKLGSLNFNNMKNSEARHEVLKNINVVDNFTIGNETQK